MSALVPTPITPAIESNLVVRRASLPQSRSLQGGYDSRAGARFAVARDSQHFVIDGPPVRGTSVETQPVVVVAVNVLKRIDGRGEDATGWRSPVPRVAPYVQAVTVDRGTLVDAYV